MYVQLNCLIVDGDATNRQELATFLSEDHEEALAAIREKREPRFRGR